MKSSKLLFVGILTASSLALFGCSSGSSSSTTTAPPTTAATPTTSPTTTSTSSSATAVNLPVTEAIRQELINAGAAINNVPPSQYTGLAAELTYYAIDKTTNTSWAAARLVPGLTSADTQAQVASQDDGSYYLFKMPSGGTWTAYPDGKVSPSSTCPAAVPPANVISAWGWVAGSCWPPAI